MSEKCIINYGKRAIKIDKRRKIIFFDDGSDVKYDKLISTLPLVKMIEIAGVEIDGELPYTSVLVMNIGALKGKKCPPYHWVYVPQSKSGFHRVGFYSNVDKSFLPLSSRAKGDRVSIYVEKSYRGGEKPSKGEIENLCMEIIKELYDWGFIEKVEVISPTWIDVAYTREYPGKDVKSEAIQILRSYDIYQVGRYGRWKFQGIAESIEDGFNIWREICSR